MPEYQLELLLGYDGRRHILESGHFLKFEVRRVISSDRVPHGLAYSLTLHTADGQRLVGFDNAHTVPHAGGRYIENPVQADHWHRTMDDPGRPYSFVSAEQLLIDFFEAVERTLCDLGVPHAVIEEK
ncbi:MAG: toxin-antitoxin system TumE family protein [Acidithiobacillus sp.]